MELIIQQSNFNDTELSTKVNGWVDSFYKEAKLFGEADIFEEFWHLYKEEPLLSLMATGIARKDIEGHIAILREYPVYRNGAFDGKSDLYLNYHKLNQHYYIEGKYVKASWETGFIEWSDESYFKEFTQYKAQVTRYAECEMQAHATAYIVVVMFHVVNFKNEADRDKYINDVKRYAPRNNQFYGCYLPEGAIRSAYRFFSVLEIVITVEKLSD